LGAAFGLQLPPGRRPEPARDVAHTDLEGTENHESPTFFEGVFEGDKLCDRCARFHGIL
jgi:hypothetical protein